MTDDNATPVPLEALLDAVENVINDASKIALITEVGVMDGASVPAHRIKELSDAYDRFIDPECFSDD
jgi:hypothetical protein